jgi:hypothetical protein
MMASPSARVDKLQSFAFFCDNCKVWAVASRSIFIADSDALGLPHCNVLVVISSGAYTHQPVHLIGSDVFLETPRLPVPRS